MRFVYCIVAAKELGWEDNLISEYVAIAEYLDQERMPECISSSSVKLAIPEPVIKAFKDFDEIANR